MLRLSKNKDMEIIKRNKYKDTYIKSHYINKYLIDDKNNRIIVYYMDGSKLEFPLNSRVISNLNIIMKDQYRDWKDYLKSAFKYNLIKILYLNLYFKKQKYFLDHENIFENYKVKEICNNKTLSKREIKKIKNLKKYTHSYFNLSSVPRYKLSTMKKIVEHKSNKK